MCVDPGSLGRFVSRSHVRLGTGFSSQQHTGVMLLQQICLWLTGVLVPTAVLSPQAASCWLGSEWAVLAASWEAPVSALLSTPGLCGGVCCLELQRCPHPYLLTYGLPALTHLCRQSRGSQRVSRPYVGVNLTSLLHLPLRPRWRFLLCRPLCLPPTLPLG